MRLTRRAMLAGAVSGLATAAVAEGPLTSMRPRARVSAEAAIARLVAQSGVSGITGVAVIDLATGAVLEDIDSSAPQPPASVAKAITALYAVETLGADHRFVTRVLTDGPVVDGVAQGNLILAGGADPDLATDDLAALAQTVKATGLREVRGDFLVWDEALRNIEEIDTDQLDYLGYNPTITGLNLNYNRVHFEWKLVNGDYTVAIDARSDNYRPAVTIADVTLVDRETPLFTYRDAGDVDLWTVARPALNDAGSRWLPVRHPALYAGEVFATFMRSQGIVLKRPKETVELPETTEIATLVSNPLEEKLRFMLRNSINLSAEVAGMTASKARAGAARGMRTSALAMSRWATERCGGVQPSFVDHSGLGDASRVSAMDMARMLAAPGVRESLYPVLRDRAVTNEAGEPVNRAGVEVRAKTGTLNFVSTLAGYVRTDQGRDLAFAIFSSDLDRREEGKRLGDERPAGSRTFGGRARTLQADILRHLALRLPA